MYYTKREYNQMKRTLDSENKKLKKQIEKLEKKIKELEYSREVIFEPDFDLNPTSESEVESQPDTPDTIIDGVQVEAVHVIEKD